jgi:hypothetical protein
MKFKFIYTLFTLLVCSVLFIASKDGRAFDQGKGNTGAPGDEVDSNGNARTCESCHNTSATIQVTLDIEVLDDAGAAITEYTPDQTYDVKVTINSLGAATPAAYGFQILCLEAPLGVSGDDAASFFNPANNVRIATASSNGRLYAEHKGPSATNEFMVEWTAPAVGTGTVTLYSCGNGVNLNDETGGDDAACSQLQLTEGDPAATKNLADEVSLKSYPNPVGGTLSLEINSEISGTFELRIYNLLGQIIKSKQLDLRTGENKENINLSDLAKGSYLLQLTDGEKMMSRKIVKL